MIGEAQPIGKWRCRRAQQQDPRHPTSRLRTARRGVSAPEGTHLHAAGAV